MNKKVRIVLGLIIIITVFVKCSKNDNGPTLTNTLITTPTAVQALPLTVASPADNTQTTQKAALGKLLFWDPILSGGKDISCATCHHPATGFSDGLALSIGVNGQGFSTARHFLSPNSIPFTKRNSQSILNAAFNGMSTAGTYDPATAPMFFDNRSQSLEAQSLEPMKTMEEMRGTKIAIGSLLDTVVARLQSVPQYQQLFAAAFATTNAITVQNLGKAIAAYERTVISNQAPFDKYMRGDATAMSTAQLQGMQAFINNGCSRCHSGPMFSDFTPHILSVPDNPNMPTDAGVNGSYAFRTPSLRNLSLTAPYMHSGVFTSLNQVLTFYDQIGDGRSQNGNVNGNRIDGNVQRFNNGDQNAILQFLNALNDGNFDKTIPATVPSGLHPGGNL